MVHPEGNRGDFVEPIRGKLKIPPRVLCILSDKTESMCPSGMRTQAALVRHEDIKQKEKKIRQLKNQTSLIYSVIMCARGNRQCKELAAPFRAVYVTMEST